MKSLIEIQYLPPIEYFCALLSTDAILLEQYEHYSIQSYRNRCYINTANGIIKLIVPIVRQSKKYPIKEARIDHRVRWQHQHWKAILSAYRKAPFFEHYADTLYHIIFKEHVYLFDMNYLLLSFCLNALNLSIPCTMTKSYHKNPNNSKIMDFRSVITPKIHHTKRLFYSPIAYFQIFGSNFEENLSIIDLLFCEGPDAIHIIQASTVK